MSKTVTLSHFHSVADLDKMLVEFLSVEEAVVVPPVEWRRTYKYPTVILAVGKFGSRFGGIFSSLSEKLSQAFHNVKNNIVYMGEQAAERGVRAKLGLVNETVSEYKGRLIAERASLEKQLKVMWTQSNPAHTGHGAPAQAVLTGKAEYASLSREEIVARMDKLNTQLHTVYVLTGKVTNV